jgi:type VI secretion system protein ImpH
MCIRDRPDTDRYAAWLGATIGLSPGTAGRDSVPDAAKLYQAGLLGGRSRHPEGLTKLLAHYFGVPAHVHSHVPHRMRIAPEDRSQLGHARNRGERNSAVAARLGSQATLGHQLWDRQYKCRIELGPLTLAQYQAFLPGSSAWRPLRDWVRLYAGHDLLWEVQLCLRAADVSTPRLGQHLRLGLTSWLGTGGKVAGQRRAHGHRADLRLRPESFFLTRRPGASHG